MATGALKMQKQHPLKVLHLDLLAVTKSLDFLAPLESWSDFRERVAHATEVVGEVLENLEQEKNK